MYRIYDISTNNAIEVTDTPLKLTANEIKSLESAGFRCIRIN